MPLVKFSESENETKEIEYSHNFSGDIKEYKKSKFTLLLNEDEKDLFIEKSVDKDWKDLFIVEKEFFSERSYTQYYRVYFNKKCIEMYSFITDIFSMGIHYGARFTLKNYK